MTNLDLESWLVFIALLLLSGFYINISVTEKINPDFQYLRNVVTSLNAL